MAGRIPPPHSERVERSVLAACLVDVGAAEAACTALRPDSFYRSAARDMFEALVALVGKGRAPDAALLEDEMRARGTFERAMGASYWNQVIDSLPDVGQLDSQLDELEDKRRQREMLDELRALGVGVANGEIDSVEAAARLSAMSAAVLPNPSERAPQEIADDLMHGPEVGTVRIPMGAIEQTLGPIFPGQKVIVAGYTSIGKTAFLVSLWIACLCRGVRVSYLSLEDSAEEIVARAMGASAWLTWGAILARSWPREDAVAEAKRIRDWFARGLGTVSYLPGTTRAELGVAVRRAVSKHKAQIVIVDYVQAVADEGRESRNQQIGRVLGELSRAASGQAVLVVGSQLNRASQGADTEPSLIHLRDSGTLEQDARAVLLLSAAGEETKDEKGRPLLRPVTINVAKNKSGARGKVPGTLWVRHSLLWPGTERPAIDFAAEQAAAAAETDNDDEPTHPACGEQEECPF